MNGNFSAEQLLGIMQAHIVAVGGRYAGRFYSWDVVNEAVSDVDGPLLKPVAPWYPIMGASYIDEAFHAAAAADPHARLFYNDYGAEAASWRKAGRVLALVQGMLQRKVPIHGVGLQCHFSVDGAPDPGDVAANMRALGALGLEVQITEMDVACAAPCTADRLAAQVRAWRYVYHVCRPCTADCRAVQAHIYAGMLSACLNVSACTSFETWGFTDRYKCLAYRDMYLSYGARMGEPLILSYTWLAHWGFHMSYGSRTGVGICHMARELRCTCREQAVVFVVWRTNCGASIAHWGCHLSYGARIV